MIPGASAASATYVIDGEDHTLGNALRYAIMRDSDVLFCGYSVPHPSEERLNIRVQVRGGNTAEAAFRRGLNNLGEAAGALSTAFSAALAAHDARSGAPSTVPTTEDGKADESFADAAASAADAAEEAASSDVTRRKAGSRKQTR